jgi:hypothetical protein
MGLIHLFSNSGNMVEPTPFNVYFRPTTFADPVETFQPIPFTDILTPLSIVPNPISNGKDQIFDKNYYRKHRAKYNARKEKEKEEIKQKAKEEDKKREEVAWNIMQKIAKYKKQDPRRRGQGPARKVHERKRAISHSKHFPNVKKNGDQIFWMKVMRNMPNAKQWIEMGGSGWKDYPELVQQGKRPMEVTTRHPTPHEIECGIIVPNSEEEVKKEVKKVVVEGDSRSCCREVTQTSS